MKRQVSRRRQRAYALKFLYADEFLTAGTDDLRFRELLESVDEETVPYTMKIVESVRKLKAGLDAVINNYSRNWNIDRISRVDLNILRIALYELREEKDVPPNVSINEAIELAKKYSNVDSNRFINGILDNYYKKELKGITR